MKHMTKDHLKRTFGAVIAACCMTAATVIPTDSMLTADAAYSTGTYTVSGQSANIRETPGENILGYALKGASFSVSRIDGSWGYSASIPATGNKTISGWIYLDNCTLTQVTPPAASGYAAGSKVEIANTPEVNFRSGAGTGYTKLGTIPKGTVLTVLEVSGGWLRVTYNGQTGWFSDAYCKAYTEPAPAPVPSTGVAAVGDKIEIINTDEVNFRSGAGTNYTKIGTIARGTVLTVDEVSGTWFRVTYDGETGWISSDYCQKYTAPAAPENPTTNTVAAVGDSVEITNTDAVNFRSGAGTGFTLIGEIPRGTVLQVLEISGNWFRVTYLEQTGWFNAGYCKKYTETAAPSTPELAVAGEKVKITAPVGVNMRSGAGTGFTLLGSIPSGTVLTVIEVVDGWYRIKYDGVDGWFTSLYAEKYTGETVTPPTQNEQPSTTIGMGDQVMINAAVAVNMRTGAGTSYAVTGTIPRGAVVSVLEISDGWIRTEYKGKTGWFVSRYCDKYVDGSSEIIDDPSAAAPTFSANGQVKISAPANVNLRSGAGKSHDVIDQIPNGEILTVLEVSGEWLRVKFNGKTGWFLSQYCIKYNADTYESVTASGKVTVNAAVSVNLRENPDASSAILGWIKGSTVLNFTDKSNGWYKVVYNGVTGWISGRYVKEN